MAVRKGQYPVIRSLFWILVLMLALAWGTQAQGQAGASHDSVSQADIDALVADIEALQRRLENNRAERSRMAQRLEETEQEIADNRRRRDQVESNLAAASAELAQLRDRESALNLQRQAQAAQVESLLASVYRSGQQTPLKALLAPESLSHGQRMMAYYQYFNAAQLEALRAYEQTLQELNQISQRIAERQRHLEQQNAHLVEENNRLLNSRNQRRQIVARLAEEISSQEEAIAAKRAERAELEQLLREMERALDRFEFGADEVPFAERKGQMIWPVEGRLALAYGVRDERTNLVTEGILVAATAGTEVRSVHYGRVVFADYLKGYGLLLILDHGSGYLSLYGRNEVLELSVGDWVRAGDVIARVGDTGGFSEPALYFEIRHQGATTNPLSWLSRK